MASEMNATQFTRVSALIFTFACFFLAAETGWCQAAGAQSGPAVNIRAHRDLGVALAQEGRCDAALKELSIVRAAAKTDTNTDTRTTADAEVHRLTGECALRLQRFGLAVEALENARAVDAKVPQVDLHLAMAHYHRGDIDEAQEAIDRAKRSDSQAPEVLLYSGLIALESSDFGRAAQHFDEAVQLADRPPEPMASFYLGRALAELDETSQAEAAFDRVIAEHPGTSWAAEAAAARERLRATREVKWWASAEIGIEHDDNVLLRGRSAGPPNEISGQSDQRGFWFADLGAVKPLNDLWSVGSILRYGGSEHHDLFRFDVHSPGGTLWLDRTMGTRGTALRLQYDVDAPFVNDRAFVINHVVGASVFQPWEVGGYTAITATFGHNDYRYDRFQIADGNAGGTCDVGVTVCGPRFLNERDATNRTGNGAGVTLTHQLPLPIDNLVAKNVSLQGRYSYQRYWSKGREYDHERHQIELSAALELPLEVSLGFGGRFADVAYGSPTVFPDPPIKSGTAYKLRTRDRREREVGAWASLERELFEQVVLAARYRYTRNHSNAEVFDFDRHIVGVSLRFTFGN